MREAWCGQYGRSTVRATNPSAWPAMEKSREAGKKRRTTVSTAPTLAACAVENLGWNWSPPNLRIATSLLHSAVCFADNMDMARRFFMIVAGLLVATAVVAAVPPAGAADQLFVSVEVEDDPASGCQADNVGPPGPALRNATDALDDAWHVAANAAGDTVFQSLAATGGFTGESGDNHVPISERQSHGHGDRR